MANVPREDNRVPGLAAKSTADNTVVVIEADPTTKRLLVNGILATGSLVEIEGHGAVGDFIKLITTGGTAEQLANNTCKRVIITALPDNTNPVAVGASTVVASTSATLRGVNLFATQSQVFFVSNTNVLFVDAVTSSEGVSVYFEN